MYQTDRNLFQLHSVRRCRSRIRAPVRPAPFENIEVILIANELYDFIRCAMGMLLIGSALIDVSLPAGASGAAQHPKHRQAPLSPTGLVKVSLSATNFAKRQSPTPKAARAKPSRSAALRDEGVLALV